MSHFSSSKNLLNYILWCSEFQYFLRACLDYMGILLLKSTECLIQPRIFPIFLKNVHWKKHCNKVMQKDKSQVFIINCYFHSFRPFLNTKFHLMMRPVGFCQIDSIAWSDSVAASMHPGNQQDATFNLMKLLLTDCNR